MFHNFGIGCSVILASFIIKIIKRFFLMDKTPKGRSGICNKKFEANNKDETIVITQLDADSCPTSTPIRTSIVDSENDDSPAFVGCTQECDDMAVVWDWNSPQAKQKVKRKPRKLCSGSPKTTFKRHPSSNQQLMFDKLKEEFEALREAIAIPDNEDCLILSPREEAEFKGDTKNESAIDSLIQSEKVNMDQDFEDIFNDSLDQELFLCTQNVEKVLSKVENSDKNSAPKIVKLDKGGIDDITILNETLTPQNKFTSENGINNNNHSYNNQQNSSNIDDKFDDSFNMVFEAFQDKDIERLTQTCSNEKITNAVQSTSYLMRRTHSDVQVEVNRSKTVQAENGKMDFLRTHSFESSRNSEAANVFTEGTKLFLKKLAHIPPNKIEEIERKRRQALEKLESKRKKSNQETKHTNISPTHCSPGEIEQKRLQAIAKLEAKKKQDLEIERKRQEALKRLEQNRLKRVFNGTGGHTKIL